MWLSWDTALSLAVTEQGRGGSQLDEPPQARQSSALSLQSGMKDFRPSFSQARNLVGCYFSWAWLLEHPGGQFNK